MNGSDDAGRGQPDARGTGQPHELSEDSLFSQIGSEAVVVRRD